VNFSKRTTRSAPKAGAAWSDASSAQIAIAMGRSMGDLRGMVDSRSGA
jgi:hypothetical protein